MSEEDDDADPPIEILPPEDKDTLPARYFETDARFREALIRATRLANAQGRLGDILNQDDAEWEHAKEMRRLRRKRELLEEQLQLERLERRREDGFDEEW